MGKIVKAKESDAKEFDKDWKKFDTSVGYISSEHFLVAYSEKKKVGYARIRLMKDLAYLKDLIVKEKHRGKGYGLKLLNASEEFAKKHKCKRIILKTTNKFPSYKFYKQQKYKIQTKLNNHYMGWTWCIMQKRLK